jgi:hypothetical protein
VITSQQLRRYYEDFGDQEVTFTREVGRILRLQPKQVFLKCQTDTLPCLIYASSMRGAKVVANLRPEAHRQLEESSGNLALRFCFAREGGSSLAFSVASRIAALTAYNRNTPELYLLSLEYTNRPPDDLIEMLGGLLEAACNASRRAEERVEVGPATLKLLGLESREAPLFVDGVEGRCLLRDLSFGGAKVLVHGQAQAYLDKPVLLRLSFAEAGGEVTLAGRVLRWEGMANREDIGAVAIRFEDSVPIQYKVAVNAAIRSSGLARRESGLAPRRSRP